LLLPLLLLQLERFLISNRDEYLNHSSKNYTAEQKQYNNWLTEQLLEVAERHRYVFDPEEFNFVAIRDRIRCYYKSYVQTARKRGLQLPTCSKNAKRAKTGDEDDENDAEGTNDKENVKNGESKGSAESNKKEEKDGNSSSSSKKEEK
jgi:hypothetical protein